MTTLKRSPAPAAPFGQLFSTFSPCFAFSVFVNVQVSCVPPRTSATEVQPLLDCV